MRVLLPGTLLSLSVAKSALKTGEILFIYIVYLLD